MWIAIDVMIMELPGQRNLTKELQPNCACKNRQLKENTDFKKNNCSMYLHGDEIRQSDTVTSITNNVHVDSEMIDNDIVSGVLSDIVKNKESCPRCLAIIRKIQNLLQCSPVASRRNLTKICDCAKAQLSLCNRCRDVKKITSNLDAALYHVNGSYEQCPKLWPTKEDKRLRFANMDEKAMECFDTSQSRASKTGTQNSMTIAPTTILERQFSKYEDNSVIGKKTNIHKLFEINVSNDVKRNITETKSNSVVKRQCDYGIIINQARRIKNTEVATNQQDPIIKIVPEQLKSKGTNYQETNIKINPNQKKYIEEELPSELKSKGINNQGKKSSYMKAYKQPNQTQPLTKPPPPLKTIRYIQEKNTKVQNTKQEISMTPQKLKSKEVIHLETFTAKINGNINCNKNKFKEKNAIRETKQTKTIRQVQSQDFRFKGVKYPEINKSKFNENKFEKNKIGYKEKYPLGDVKKKQSKINKDLILKDTKFNDNKNKYNAQKVYEKIFELEHETNQTSKGDFVKGKCVNNSMKENQKATWPRNPIAYKSKPEFKPQKRHLSSKNNKALAETHKYSNKLNKSNIQLGNQRQKQFLMNFLQPVDHLRGGGPQLYQHSKNGININSLGELTKLRDSKNHKEPRKQLKENDERQQLTILKNMLEDNNIQIKTLPIVTEHATHKYKTPGCLICQDSELSLDLSSFTKKKIVKDYEYIQNKTICTSKTKPIIVREEKRSPRCIKAKVFYDLNQELSYYSLSSSTKIDSVPKDGVVRYALSNREFIDKGWTILPFEKILRRYNVYRMRPAYPEFNWFEHNKNNGIIKYKTGEKLANCDDNGHKRLYYKSGQVALDFYVTEDEDSKERIVIYSKNGVVDQTGRSHPVTVLAVFDHMGNGIVFDINGKTRLKYNQSEGLILDQEIGPISRWKWHSLNDPPNLESDFINTHLDPRDDNIMKIGFDDTEIDKPLNEDVIATEFNNTIKEKQKTGKLVFNRFEIKPKALKINKEFSLKIMDQTRIYIIFRDGGLTYIKLNIGMVLDSTEVVSVHTEEMGEVLNSIEKEPVDTKSLENLKSYVEAARRIEQKRIEQQKMVRLVRKRITTTTQS